jgi:hypothetical protein
VVGVQLLQIGGSNLPEFLTAPVAAPLAPTLPPALEAGLKALAVGFQTLNFGAGAFYFRWVLY